MPSQAQPSAPRSAPVTGGPGVPRFPGFAGLLARGFASLKRENAMRIGRGMGWVMSRVLRLRRGEVLATLARCFPGMPAAERAAVYRAMWRNLMTGFVELCRYAGGLRDEVLSRREVVGRENLDAIFASGRPVIALLAHLGNYPLLAADVPPLFGVELSFIYKTFRSAGATRVWQAFQQAAGIEGIPSRNSYRPALRALRAGRVLGFMLDQNRPGHEGVFVPFFGRPASTSPGLALLSWQAKAPVLSAFEHRAPDGHYVVELGTPVEPPPDREPATLADYTARYTALIEAEIRRHPAEWLWLHRRWKTQPPATAGCQPAEPPAPPSHSASSSPSAASAPGETPAP